MDDHSGYMRKKIAKQFAHYFLIGITTCSLIQCQQGNYSNQKKSPSHNQSIVKRKWQKLRCGLYLHANGDIGFPTAPHIVFVPPEELEGERAMCPNKFLTMLKDRNQKPLKQVVDTTTFTSLGAHFYKDKSHLYFHFSTCDGGYLKIFANDTTSFSVINGLYVRYKSNIYYNRLGQIKADAKTFQGSKEFAHIGKDKQGFFSFGKRISAKALEKDMGKKLFRRLKESL